ncbi:MAG: hypothetical protein JRJ27_16760 [Deltaproteobacteria bacterium]|nr:hypothetical protein [Deltaproteobacteria bacterium]
MKKLWLLTFVCVVSAAFCIGGASGADFCVVPNGSGETSLQGALTEAQSNNEADIIKVVQGTYNGNFTYYSSQGYGVTLEGGWATGCSVREVSPTNTILDGLNSGRSLSIIQITNGGDVEVDGFTIQNGNDPGSGGGVHASSTANSGTAGNILLANNNIKDNTISTYQGGGVYAASDADDTAYAGTVTIINNIIAGNSASGALSTGGGVHASSTSESFSGETVTLLNNTITGNTAEKYGGGLYIYTDDNTHNIFNNIIWGNSAETGWDIAFNYTIGGSTENGFFNDYSDIYPSDPWDNEIDNIDADPRLNTNHHLKPSSPCIDAGTNGIPNSPSTDIDGDDRIIDGDKNDAAITDIGADEYVPRGLISFLMLLLN